MRLFRALSKRIHPSRVEAELDTELRAYIEMAVEQKVRDGMDPAAARRSALIEFGGVAAVKEQVRDASALAWLDTCWQDARYALRGLRQSPGFTIIALLSLALGVGANSAIFAVFYSVVVRPLPYPASSRLVAVGRGAPGRSGAAVITPEFVAWQNDQHVFTGLASWNDAQFNLTGAATPERLAAAEVSPNFLQVLGLHPAFGRDFAPSERGAAIVTYELWQRQFAGDPTAIGQSILLSDVPFTLVGVLPAGFQFPANRQSDVLIPDDLPNPPNFNATRFGGLHGIGRLRAGATIAGAVANLSAISWRYQPQIPAFVKRTIGSAAVTAQSLHTELSGDSRPVLAAMLGAVALLLLLACVNVANLQIARAAARRREIGLRVALGASRARIARLLVMENLALASLAGALGLLLASALPDLLPESVRTTLPGAGVLHLGWQLAAAAFLFAILAGLLTALTPALLAPRLDVNDVLKSGANSLVSGNGARVRSFLVGTQVALALVLLLGSGLLLRSLQSVLSIDLGYRTDHILMANLRLAGPHYTEDAQKSAFLQSVLDRLQTLPGVESAAIVNSPPLAGGYSLGMFLRFEPQPSPDKGFGSAIVAVTPDYLRTLGIRLLRGRNLDDRDRSGASPVALVNEEFARQAFHGADPLGKIVYGFDEPETIVGVFASVRHSGPEKTEDAEMLVSQWQHPQHVANLVIRTKENPLALASALRAVVWAVDRNLPITDISTMDDRLARVGAGRRVQTTLLAAFGLLALLLSAVGIFGVAAEAVAQRTREIGLRMALGARADHVVRTIMAHSLMLSLFGIAAGAGAGFFLVRYLKTLLFGIKPTDTVAFAAAASLLFAVSLLAAFIPARRAARIDPMVALRCD